MIYREQNLDEGDLIWLIKDDNRREYYNLSKITEKRDECDGLIWSAIVQMNDEIYKKAVVKLWYYQTQYSF